MAFARRKCKGHSREWPFLLICEEILAGKLRSKIRNFGRMNKIIDSFVTWPTGFRDFYVDRNGITFAGRSTS